MNGTEAMAWAVERMMPRADDAAQLAEHFARQEADCACLGYVLATYLTEVVSGTVGLHAAECHNPRCHTCAGIATALLGIAAHRHLLTTNTTREETKP